MARSDLPIVEDIGEFYDSRGELIELLGSNIHVGYWYDEHDRTPLLEAVNRLTDIVGDKLGLRPGDRLLDVGCGAGIPAIRIAQRTDADVTGITNSRFQAGFGSRRADEDGLHGQVRIEHGDAAALPYPSGSFDAVLAFESLPHAHDRGEWLRGMARVLRPGGRLVLTEFEFEQPLSAGDVAIIRAGGLDHPLTRDELLEIVRSSGFVVDEAVSCGSHIRRSYGEFLARVRRRRDILAAADGGQRVDQYLAEMRTLLAVYERIGYLIVTAHRPG